MATRELLFPSSPAHLVFHLRSNLSAGKRCLAQKLFLLAARGLKLNPTLTGFFLCALTRKESFPFPRFFAYLPERVRTKKSLTHLQIMRLRKSLWSLRLEKTPQKMPPNRMPRCISGFVMARLQPPSTQRSLLTLSLEKKNMTFLPWGGIVLRACLENRTQKENNQKEPFLLKMWSPRYLTLLCSTILSARPLTILTILGCGACVLSERCWDSVFAWGSPA